MTHTKEPWAWVISERRFSDMGGIYGACGGQVCHFGDAEQFYPTEGEPPSEDDLARLLACVNTLAGIPDPAALVDSHKALVEFVQYVAETCDDEHYVHKANAVLKL